MQSSDFIGIDVAKATLEIATADATSPTQTITNEPLRWADDAADVSATSLGCGGWQRVVTTDGHLKRPGLP